MKNDEVNEEPLMNPGTFQTNENSENVPDPETIDELLNRNEDGEEPLPPAGINFDEHEK